jgi:glucose/arabinose dehydrogenase
MNLRHHFLVGAATAAFLIAAGCGRATPPPAPTATLAAPPPTVAPATTAPAATAPPTETPAPAATSRPTETPAPTATARPSPTSEPTATPPPTATPAPAATTAPTNTPPPSPTPKPTAVPLPKVETLVSGLEAPWAIAFAPDGRIFVTERPGRIRIIEGGKLLPQPWMTLDVAATGEAGLLGLALDPDFAQNHYVYVAYTVRAGAGLENRLVRLRDDPATGQGVLDRVLLEGVRGNIFHDGGRVKFGPDGKLYWTMGDAQNGALAQDVGSLNGKILRINPDGTIPDDNPFPGSPVYSYGHRNPQGLAWQPPSASLATQGSSGGRPADKSLEPGARLAGQPGTGRLYETEHGPTAPPICCRDEVNFIEPGKNYGWPTITADQTHAGMVSPVLQSGTTQTWAPSGATFVTGGPWDGSLLFAGLRGESLYRVVLDPSDPRRVILFERLFAQQYGRLRDVVQGPDRALYVLTSNLDGRGTPPPEGDVVLRLSFASP